MPRSSHEQHSEWAACWLIGSWRTARSGRGADLELEFAAHLRQLIDQVLPLAYAQPAEILALADTAQRIVARLAIGLEDTVPDVQRGQIVAGRVRIPVVDAVGLIPGLVRAFTRILKAQERHDHQHGSQRVGRAGFRGLDHHAAETDIDGDAGELPSDMRQRHLAALAADRLELRQLVEAVGDRLHVRWVDEPEIRHILGRTGDAHRQHVQHHGTQRCAQDLRLGEPRAGLVVLTRIQADGDAVRDTAAPAGPLIGARLADRLDGQPLHLGGLRIPADAGRARVDHVADARHGQ